MLLEDYPETILSKYGNALIYKNNFDPKMFLSNINNVVEQSIAETDVTKLNSNELNSLELSMISKQLNSYKTFLIRLKTENRSQEEIENVLKQMRV